uniref:BTB domain-containing protein n=1 Tax=Stomoxys calcitrans TaxID=35570 RepID=A0A1I8PCH9_STOCA
MNPEEINFSDGDLMDVEIKTDEITENLPPKRVYGAVSDEALETLNELRCSNSLCDAKISVPDGSFNVHRAIMSACSSYFRAQFTSRVSTPHEDKDNYKNQVYVPTISASIMEEVINYAYLRKCTINAENVHELWVWADYFGILGLMKTCEQYLIEMLTPENCIGLMGFARTYPLKDLYGKARNYVMRFFPDVVCKSKEILQLNIMNFYDIISDDELNTRDEDLVWKLCLKWIDEDPEDRMKHIAQLMLGVRLALMTPKCFMEEVKEHPYVASNEETKPLIVETIRFMYDLNVLNPTGGELTTPPLAMPRLPHEIIFSIGGWSGGTSKGCIETYDTRADRWVQISAEDPAGPRAYHGAAVIGYKIYLIGGYDGLEYFNTCRVFDASTKSWNEIAPMHSRRCYVSVALLNGLIYAIGGYDGNSRLNTVERYKPKTNQWTMVNSMNLQRSDASACTLNGKIYAVGGFNGHECLNSAEVFDPITEVWTRIPNMHERRSGVSCVAFRGMVYVVGGFNGIARLVTGERFDPASQTWSPIGELNIARSNFGLEAIDDMIFAIAGFNGVSTISHVECYVPETNEWMEAADMNIVRSALTANKIDGLPNKRDYIHKERNRLLEERRQRLLSNAMINVGANISESNASMVMAQENGLNEHDLLAQDDDVDVDIDVADIDLQNLNIPVGAPAIFNMRDNDPNPRFRNQARAHRFGSHHEMRRRF